MSQVTVKLPGMLCQLLTLPRAIPLEAESLSGALACLVATHPALAVHLFDESGQLRRHVICFHNGVHTRRGDALDASVAAGDEVVFLQSVAGG